MRFAINRRYRYDAAGLSAVYVNIVEHGGNTAILSVIFRICDALAVEPAVLTNDAWHGR